MLSSGMGAAWRACWKVAEWCRKRGTAAAGEAPWVARQVRDNTERVAALEARVAAAEAKAAATAEAFCRAFTAAGQPVPDTISADMPTAPLLRVVS